MTFKEFGRLADAIKTYFPRDPILPTDEAMELWYDMLKDLDYKAAYMGLKKHVAVSRFAPTIADIREHAAEMNVPQELNEMEAWTFVSKALRNSGYHSVEEFAKLPPLVQKAVGVPDQLRVWALDGDYNEQVVSSNFMRTYRTVIARQKEVDRTPKQIQVLMEKTNAGSYAARLEQKRQEAAETLGRKQRGNQTLEMGFEGVPMPEKYREVLAGQWRKTM